MDDGEQIQVGQFQLLKKKVACRYFKADCFACHRKTVMANSATLKGALNRAHLYALLAKSSRSQPAWSDFLD